MGDRFARIRGQVTDDWNDQAAPDRVQSLIRNAFVAGGPTRLL